MKLSNNFVKSLNELISSYKHKDSVKVIIFTVVASCLIYAFKKSKKILSSLAAHAKIFINSLLNPGALTVEMYRGANRWPIVVDTNTRQRLANIVEDSEIPLKLLSNLPKESILPLVQIFYAYPMGTADVHSSGMNTAKDSDSDNNIEHAHMITLIKEFLLYSILQSRRFTHSNSIHRTPPPGRHINELLMTETSDILNNPKSKQQFENFLKLYETLDELEEEDQLHICKFIAVVRRRMIRHDIPEDEIFLAQDYHSKDVTAEIDYCHNNIIQVMKEEEPLYKSSPLERQKLTKCAFQCFHIKDVLKTFHQIFFSKNGNAIVNNLEEASLLLFRRMISDYWGQTGLSSKFPNPENKVTSIIIPNNYENVLQQAKDEHIEEEDDSMEEYD
ncbi:MAG: hypothetical protein KAH32_01590 [Chlamydiia bacterium]|nr:hypothetical protein [Chlamydiia bacterium]